MKTQRDFFLTIALVLGIILAVNLLGRAVSLRADFTADQRYTLSQATKDILTDLNDPITVTAYFSDDLPPEFARTKDEFRELLVEYANRSGGNVVYEFINPNESAELEQEAIQNGLAPRIISVRERDQMTQKRAFLGALLQLGENKEAIPFILSGGAMEYALSTSIKKLAVVDKPSVAFLQGHGEPPPDQLPAVMQALSVLYNVETLDLNTEVAVPDRLRALAIVAPTDSFPPAHLAALDAFLAQGGELVVALNRVQGNFSAQVPSGTTLNTGLETWLQSKGLQVDAGFVIAANCGTVGVQQQQGGFRFTSQVQFPYFPIVNNFSDHPITEGLEAAIFQFVSPIYFTGDSTLTFTPLVQTAELAGTQPAPVYFDINKQWGQQDFPLNDITLGGLVEGPMGGPEPARLIVLGDGDLAFAEGGDGINLVVNSIDWLSDDTGLIELRSQGVTARLLDQLEDGTKTLLKYTNFLLPIVLIVGYGIFRAQRRRTQRLQRQAANYA